MALSTIARCTTGIEAHILKGRLEADGVPAFVLYEHHVWAKWYISVALGGVRVAVPSNFDTEAEAVLRRLNTTMYEAALAEEVGESESTGCPKCGSELLIERKWTRGLSLFSSYFFGIPLPYTQHQISCTSCGHQSILSEDRNPSIFVRAAVIFMLVYVAILGLEVWRHWCAVHCASQYYR